MDSPQGPYHADNAASTCKKKACDDEGRRDRDFVEVPGDQRRHQVHQQEHEQRAQGEPAVHFAAGRNPVPGFFRVDGHGSGDVRFLQRYEKSSGGLLRAGKNRYLCTNSANMSFIDERIALEGLTFARFWLLFRHMTDMFRAPVRCWRYFVQRNTRCGTLFVMPLV